MQLGYNLGIITPCEHGGKQQDAKEQLHDWVSYILRLHIPYKQMFTGHPRAKRFIMMYLHVCCLPH